MSVAVTDRAELAGWRVVLPEATATAAISAAKDVAGRLRDPEHVAACAAVAAEQSAFSQYLHWSPHDMAQGDAGLAVFFGHLDACFPDAGWDVAAHGCLTTAARTAERMPHPRTSLFGGLGGVAFAAQALSYDGKRYGRLLAELDRWLLPRVARDGSTAETAAGVAVGSFDVISGLAGTGAYLLCRRHDPSVAPVLRAVLSGLVALCDESGGLPNWHTPFEALTGDETMTRQFPYGNLNCGLAHGIPGPLALLSISLDTDVAVPGQRDAVSRVAEWLVGNRADDTWGVNWPSAVALPSPTGVVAPPGPARSAWCYGSPGVARALWLAGSALDDAGLRELSIEAMEATFRRPREVRAIDSPSFCHGIAGLLQVTLRFAQDTGDPMFTQAARDLAEQLLEMYDPDSLLGYRNIEWGGNLVDHPGLLDGAPGVALVLLAAATNVSPAWDRLFLLS